LKNVWNVDEVKTFRNALKQDGDAQWIALFAVLMDSGARKNEVLGLQWRDLNGKVLHIERQLMDCEVEGTPVFAPPKRGEIRSIELSEETTTLLREHKRQQSETKMANRPQYRDHELIFARSWENLGSKHPHELGEPLSPGSVNGKLGQLCKAAKVRAINVHGLRHTCATQMLAAGVSPHVVQRRLGHKSADITLNVYSHVTTAQQGEAAELLSARYRG
jgi:integrase